MTRTVTVTFTDCRLAISKTAEPKFNRTYTWTVQKVVTSAPEGHGRRRRERPPSPTP